jgi:putative tryptophan/tyrosine transport system substrate-binding protein
MRRREFISLFGGAVVAWPLAARAQRERSSKGPDMRFASAFCGTVQPYFPMPLKPSAKGCKTSATLRVGTSPLSTAGQRENQNVCANELAAELVRLKVDVIMAPSSIYTGAAKAATSTIPVIFMSHAAPLETGHVASLARPGGNITGLSLMQTETGVKGLELLKEAVMPQGVSKHEHHVSPKLRNANRPNGRQGWRSAPAILANRRTVIGRSGRRSCSPPSGLRVT